jgi:hypothetical protein
MILNRSALFVAPTDPEHKFVGLTLHCLPFSAYWFAFRVSERTYFISDEPHWDTMVWGVGQ